jgi:hypothetical protein
MQASDEGSVIGLAGYRRRIVEGCEKVADIVGMILRECYPPLLRLKPLDS